MKKLNLTARLLCLLCLFPAIMQAQSIAGKADTLLTAYFQQDLFTGTVLIAKNNQVVFEKSYGMANRASGTPNTSNTEYRIGSISKPFTSMIILQLKDKGLIKLDDPLSKYIQGFEQGDSIRIEHLLNHTSGIKSFTSTAKYRTQRASLKSEKDVLEILKAEPKQFAPGTSWQYSNSNYMLLSYIAEKITGKPMNILVKEFSENIGLKKTGMDLEGRVSKNKAIGYEAGTLEDFQQVTENNIDIITGAGGLYSTVKDLYKLDKALYTESILRNATKQQMFKPIKGDYALGWEISNYVGAEEIGHSGSIEGFKSMILRYPSTGTTIIFLSNYWNTPGPEICESLKAITFEQPYNLPIAKAYRQLTEEQLRSFEGEYSFNGKMTMSLKAASGLLLSTIKGQPVVSFRALQENKFFNKSNNAMIQFNSDASSFKLIKGKQEMEWVRVHN